ncbi:MAG: hypothetical protein HQL88_06270 [Magnetococcales bacterium]|nr:hypothetical protein [Magnetococcales bacterium]
MRRPCCPTMEDLRGWCRPWMTPPGLRGAWIGVGLSLALGMAVWAGRWGMAALHSYPARWVLEGWEQVEQPLSTAPVASTPATEERWRAAVAGLARAQSLEPDNADTFSLLGRLHHHHALRHSPWSPQAKGDWRQAILAYQRALQLRPTWGALWILLAQARLQSGEAPAQVMADWGRALRFAPRSRDVQLPAIRIGFALWSLLDGPQRALMDNLLEQTFAQEGEIILQQAAKYQLLKQLQPLLAKYPQWHKRYQQLSPSR